MQQATRAAIIAGRRACDREHAASKDLRPVQTFLGHAGHPVERVLEQWRQRGIIFRCDDENALVLAEQRREFARLLRLPLAVFEIAVINRHRVISEIYVHGLDAVGGGDVLGEPREPLAVGMLPRAAGEEQKPRHVDPPVWSEGPGRTYSPLPSKTSLTRAKKPADSGLVFGFDASSKDFNSSRCLRVRFFGVSTSTWI